MARHIIHKQTVTLHMPDAGNSNLLQDKVSHLLRNEMNDVMEALFDKISADGEVIRIDKLALDLGTIAPGNFNVAFKARLTDELIKALPKAKSNAGSKDGAAVMSYTESVMESLQYFLTHGRLPWYAGIKQMAAWETEILTKFTDTDWGIFAEWFKEQFPLNPVIAERLILQFSDKFIIAFLAGTGHDTKSVDSPDYVYQDLYFYIGSLTSQQPDAIRFAAWSSFLESFFTATSVVDVLKTIAGKIASESKSTSDLFAVLINTHWHKELQSPTVTAAIDELLNDRQFINNLKHGSKTIENKPSRSSSDEESKIRAAKTGKSRSGDRIAEDFIFVQNSGIVLLNPFLQQYFAEFGLLRKKDFVDLKAQKRAVMLLHYLATGSNEAAEFDLALQKVLCGLPVEEPLPNAIDFTEKEMAEAEKMLTAVTQHWKPLNNTSVEGLRTTFLQREGKMRQTDDDWKLEIETKTVDVLLGKLPWGFSTIRLPWLKYLVHVEWY